MVDSVAAVWNRNRDIVIEAADATAGESPVVRRSAVDAALRNHGLILQSRQALVTLFDKCRFFEKAPMKGWLEKVFPLHARDAEERVLRFVEEAMELAQTQHVTRAQLHALVDQVMDKPVGDVEQELGGVMVTLAAFCVVADLDAAEAFSDEFARCNEAETILKIQRKHEQKLVVSSKLR